MQKLGLSQQLQQKLSPQQIQFIKLLQVPTAELENRIEEELEINPALEEGESNEQEQEPSNESESSDEQAGDEQQSDEQQEEPSKEEDIDIKDYLADDDYAGYKTQGDGPCDDDED